MMKRLMCVSTCLWMLSLMATELTVNKPLEGSLTDAQLVSIAGTPTVAEGAVSVLTANVLFTIPSETPTYEDAANEKLALAVNSEGYILIANGEKKSWTVTTVKTNEKDPIAVYAEGRLNDDEALVFTVTLNGGTAYEVTSPVSGGDLNFVETVGDGEVSALSLALVDTTIIPGDADAKQDPALVQKYVSWLNDETKGGAMSDDASAEQLADAFAMNVGGMPALDIVAVDPVAGTVTLKGSSTVGTTTNTVSLQAINGKIYLSWSESLSGEVTVSEASIVGGDANEITVELPDAARFVKAAVALEAPTETSL
jgi:hypothetical protein